ncbi:hypothetical protein P2318_15360 [Myxococcaceae bacterium GXIMD 01537]
MNQQLANKLNSLTVSVYKVLGSLLLGLILLGLITYLGTQAFFLINRGWAAPTIISPTDPNILQLSAQAAQQASARDKLLSERREVQGRLEDAIRVSEAEHSFQQRFGGALAAQREAQDLTLQKLNSLRAEYYRARKEISESNRAYAGLARGRTDALFGARLVSQEEHLTTQHQLAQMAQTNLALSQNAVELDARLEALRRELRGLDAAQAGLDGKDALGRTPDVLLLEREYTRSTLERARADSSRQNLGEDLRALDLAVTRYEQLIATIQSSPYLRAMAGNLAVAFVPYENLENATPGTALYACSGPLVWCHEVGTVGKVLEGEVSVKHPIRQHFLRGVMVELRLQDSAAARNQLLHLGRPPLLL